MPEHADSRCDGLTNRIVVGGMVLAVADERSDTSSAGDAAIQKHVNYGQHISDYISHSSIRSNLDELAVAKLVPKRMAVYATARPYGLLRVWEETMVSKDEMACVAGRRLRTAATPDVTFSWVS